MTENKRYYIGNGENCTICDSNQGGSDFYNMLTQFEAVDRLNEQDERIKDLLRYKYLVKALEEVSGSHYIEEIISDYSDGAVSDEKEQLELGKWHSEHGLSWEDGDIE